MLRQTRRVVVSALLALVVFAGSAAAQCAWVLWQYDESGWHYPVVVPQVSETRAECEKSREELIKDWQTRGYNARSACLPETMDPRGPKGSGR